MSTPSNPPIVASPRARAGVAVRRLARLPYATVRALLLTVRRLLARTLWLLRGWAGLIVGLFAALVIWLGPARGARWIAAQATVLYWHVAATLTLAQQTAYDAVALPAAAILSYAHALGHWDHYLSHFPRPALSWRFWMRHGAAWRYAQLQRPGAVAVRALLPWEIGGSVVSAALLVWLVVRILRRRGLDPSKTNTFGGARWQTWAELKARRATPGDLVLGTARRGLTRVTVGVPAHLLVEGVGIDAPNGLGKSNSFFKPQLLQPDPDVDYIATDNKGDAWEETAAAAARTHDVYRLDMRGTGDSVTWAPLALVRIPAQARDWAGAWLHNSRPADSAAPQPYFEDAVRLLMAAGIMHVHAVAAAAGRHTGTLDELRDLLLKPSVEEMIAELKKGPSGAETGPAAQFLELIAQHRDLRSSIPSGLAPRLSALTDPAIRSVVGGHGTLDLDRLGRTGRRPIALYIVLPPGDDTLRPLVAALFTTIFTTLLDRARGLPGGKLAREVRLLLDEFGTMGAIPNAPKWFNICRQPRISRVLAWQMRAQLYDDYGDGAKAIIESCNALAWLGGTRDEDAQWASDLIGKRTVLAHGESDSSAVGGDRSGRSASEAGVPLLFPEDLAASTRRRVVVSVREARPMDLRTRPVWAVHAYKRLMKLPAPVKCYEAPIESVTAPVMAVTAVPTTAPAAPPASTKEPKMKTPTATASSTPPATSTSATQGTQGWTPAAPIQSSQGTGTPVKWTTLP